MRFIIAAAILSFACAKPSPENVGEFGSHYEGDILYPLPKMSETRNGLIDESYRWPNGQVAYIFDSEFTTDSRIEVVLQAMEEYRTTTGGCIEFVERTTESDYIRITDTDSGCFSNVGRIGGEQQINYAFGCYTYGTVQHEMYHALGFYHEQSRSDRDDYVTINWDNIQLIYQGNFVKQSADVVTGFGEAYDYLSVMHYPQTAFAIDSSVPTIYTTDPDYQDQIGQRVGLSQTDWNKLMAMYNC